jgi:multiple sugar transport system permease protein
MATTAGNNTGIAKKRLSRLRYGLGQSLVVTLLTLGLVITLLPFTWMMLNSIKTNTEAMRVPPTFWPENPTLENFRRIFSTDDLPLRQFYANSIIVALSNVLITLFTSSLFGFLFAKYEFPGKRIFFGWFMLGMMIPGVSMMIPDYMILNYLGLLNKLAALIVLGALDAFGIFMMRQFIESLPNELIDAGRIDGASEFRIYWSIILPQLGPALATLGTLTFMGNWNAYLWPMVVLTKKEVRTLPVILTWFNTQHGTRPGLTSAANVLVVVPILVVYFLVQRWIVRGSTMSGLK